MDCREIKSPPNVFGNTCGSMLLSARDNEKREEILRIELVQRIKCGYKVSSYDQKVCFCFLGLVVRSLDSLSGLFMSISIV